MNITKNSAAYKNKATGDYLPAYTTYTDQLYPDEIVALLPYVTELHQAYAQWTVAKKYTKRLSGYISQNTAAANILVVNCNNGWLAAQLSKCTTGLVMGIEINTKKIQQAKRVFGSFSNLYFEKATLAAFHLLEKKFDIILLVNDNGALLDIPALLHSALPQLSLFGEVHIITTSFTKQHKSALRSFRSKMAYDAGAILSTLFFTKRSFYHIIVKSSYL